MKRGAIHPAWPVAALMAACAALRLPNLRALPIFGDEAIFLHAARILRQDPFPHLWISLLERTPPLHAWLLALSLPLSSDPVSAGRLLSVASAVLTVPALYALCRALEAGCRRAPAFLACILFVASPLLTLHDRMARVEAIFVLEMTLAALLSVRLAAAVRSGRAFVLHALGLGLVMGCLMLTRQAVSYVLWALPVAAFVLLGPFPAGRRGSDGRRLSRSLAAAAAVALALWLPMLLARTGPSLATRILPLQAVHEAASTQGWMLLTARNAGDAVSWLWLYLTPPVALAAIASLAFGAIFGRGRVAAFLAIWGSLILVPALPLSNAFFPRYVVPGAIPLLAAAGFGLGAVLERSGRVAAGILVAAVLAWPVRDVVRQVTDWRTETLAPVDHWQFVSGWPGGFATEQAARHLATLATGERLVIITSPDSGNPADTLWLLLEGQPGIELASAGSLDHPVFSAAGKPDVLRFQGDPRLGAPARELNVSPQTQLLYVSRERIYTKDGLTLAADTWRGVYPSMRPVARFENPPAADGKPGDAVVVLAIR